MATGTRAALLPRTPPPGRLARGCEAERRSSLGVEQDTYASCLDLVSVLANNVLSHADVDHPAIDGELFDHPGHDFLSSTTAKQVHR
jgi:hypothetical protein